MKACIFTVNANVINLKNAADAVGSLVYVCIV